MHRAPPGLTTEDHGDNVVVVTMSYTTAASIEKLPSSRKPRAKKP